MAKMKLLPIEYGPIWAELVEQYGHPLDGLAPLSRLPHFTRDGDEWDNFFQPDDFTLAVEPSPVDTDAPWPNVDRDERNPVELTQEFRFTEEDVLALAALAAASNEEVSS